MSSQRGQPFLFISRRQLPVNSIETPHKNMDQHLTKLARPPLHPSSVTPHSCIANYKYYLVQWQQFFHFSSVCLLGHVDKMIAVSPIPPFFAHLNHITLVYVRESRIVNSSVQSSSRCFWRLREMQTTKKMKVFVHLLTWRHEKN